MSADNTPDNLENARPSHCGERGGWFQLSRREWDVQPTDNDGFPTSDLAGLAAWDYAPDFVRTGLAALRPNDADCGSRP